MNKNTGIRFLLMLGGNLMIGVGIAFSLYAQMGNDPFSTMNLGFSNFTGILFGTIQLIINCILFMIPLLFDRSQIGLGTIGNMVLVGYCADFFSPLCAQLLNMLSFNATILAMIVGVLITSFGCAFYLAAQMGASPWDSMAFVVTKHFPSIPYMPFRIAQDLLALLIGFIFHATIGLSSLIHAFCLGSFISFFSSKIRAFFLKEKQTEVC